MQPDIGDLSLAIRFLTGPTVKPTSLVSLVTMPNNGPVGQCDTVTGFALEDLESMTLFQVLQ